MKRRNVPTAPTVAILEEVDSFPFVEKQNFPGRFVASLPGLLVKFEACLLYVCKLRLNGDLCNSVR